MSDTVEIRPVTPADYEAWLPLWDGYNRFYGRFGPTALPEAITRTTWSRFFDGLEPMHALVAVRGGNSGGHFVGLVHYIFHRSTTLQGPTCYLQDLFTAESERGKGVGRALIEGVYAAAKAANASRVYWHTHETNHTAMRLYDGVADKPGFVMYRKDV